MENKIKKIKKLTISELETLAQEIRTFLINKVSSKGGHLASNLGVVELTLALFYVFDFKKDKIIFDVGHQSYVYKMLTGRIKDFDKLRELDGISGFPSILESKYDYFNTGHSSTSISAGIGYARSRDLKGEKYHVISLIGDASIANGMAQEAINDLGYRKTKMIIILNDNGMSINENVGSLASYFSKLSLNKRYLRVKKNVKNSIHNKNVYSFLKWFKDGIRNFLVPNEFYEKLGLTYVGPIDGHNLGKMVEVLKRVRDMEEPIIIHVRTKKGLGYEKALLDPALYHGVSPFDQEKGVIKKYRQNYGEYIGEYLTKLAQKDHKIVAITSAMTDGVGLSSFAIKYPNRFFDVGIAEEHATCFAAGLAINHVKPYLFLYSTFLQRGFDQVIHDICMMNLPVKIMIDRAGLVGPDGKTHQGLFDLSYLSMIPNITIMAPKCISEIPAILNFINQFKNPIALRYPKGCDTYPLSPIKDIFLGKWEVIRESDSKLAIIATGKMVETVMEMVNKFNLDALIINACFIKPLDFDILNRLKKEGKKIITVEDNVIKGGLGSNILLYLNQINYKNTIKILGFPDEFIPHGTTKELYKKYHLDIDGIFEEVININK